MARALYSLLLRAALPLILLRLWWRGRREAGYREHVAERLGRYQPAAQRPILWVHAVSVGEARAAAPLVGALQREFEGHDVLLTCMTAAGREAARQLYRDAVRLAYLPYDYPGAVRRFLEHFRPRIGVLMETEIWPNLLAACAARRVPVMLANARMSEKSARGYARWSSLARPALASLGAVCAQSEADARRLVDLGAAHVSVTGNLKFDVDPDARQLAEGRALRAALAGRRTLLLASTREGEEALLLDALAERPRGVLLVVVPRHPQRFDAVAQLLAQRAIGTARRSRGELPGAGQAAYLGDTMGEMAFYYGLADVAVIGGGFAPLGGQNLIEACAAGAPVVLGPHMFNFSEATRLAIEAGAALQVGGAPEAARAALELLDDEARRARMSEAGIRMCAAHRGATARHVAACRELLKNH
jgi:3-deoxy-D-manno-octulosonic-acid transferase